MVPLKKPSALALLVLCAAQLTHGQMPLQKVVRPVESTLRSPEVGQFRDSKFAPGGNLISFEVIDRQGDTHLYIENLSTKKKMEILIPQAQAQAPNLFESPTRKLGPNYAGQLKWCPALLYGKQWFAFVASAAGNQDVYVGRTENLGTYYRVTSHSGIDDDPIWTPDGESLVFTGRHRAKADLFIIRDFRGLVKRLNEGTSPNTRLAGVETLDNGTWLEQITQNDGDDIFPSFSPDGTWMAYSVLEASKSSLFVWNAGSRTQVHLIDDKERVVRNPSFSPDGRLLAYYSAPGRKREEPVSLVVASVIFDGDEIKGLKEVLSYKTVGRMQDVKGRVPGGPYWTHDGNLLFLNDKKGQKNAIYELTADALANGRAPSIKCVMSDEGALPFNIVDFDLLGENDNASTTIFSAQRGDEFGIYSDLIERSRPGKKGFVDATGYIVTYANDDDNSPQPGGEIEGRWEVADRFSLGGTLGIENVRKDLDYFVYAFPSIVYRITRLSSVVLHARAGVGCAFVRWKNEPSQGNPWIIPVGLEADVATGMPLWLVVKWTIVVVGADLHPSRVENKEELRSVDYYMQFSIGVGLRF